MWMSLSFPTPTEEETLSKHPDIDGQCHLWFPWLAQSSLLLWSITIRTCSLYSEKNQRETIYARRSEPKDQLQQCTAAIWSQIISPQNIFKSHLFLSCSACSLSLCWPCSSSIVTNALLLSIKRFWERTDAIHLKQINPKQSHFKQEGLSNTLMPIVSPSLRWNGAPSSDSAFLFFFFLESCWLWK